MYYAQIDSKHILRVVYKIDALRLINSLIRIGQIAQTADVGSLVDVFNNFAVLQIVYQQLKQTLRLVTGSLGAVHLVKHVVH